jgi:membrane fusion protein, multidrug efflux system
LAVYVDKGDRVKKGQVIAILESPETDKEVADALANYKLQAITYDRYEYLLKKQVVPQQTADNWHASMLQAQAFYQQNLAMQAYEIVRAPVDGIITARYFDPGAMIPQATTPVSATTGPGYPTNTTSSPIVAMATLQPLRIYAYAPQPLTPLIHDGDHASVSVDEYPGQEFDGTVTRHPDALDEASRTMLVEVDLPNRDLNLMPGMYGKLPDDRTNHGRSGRTGRFARVYGRQGLSADRPRKSTPSGRSSSSRVRKKGDF